MAVLVGVPQEKVTIDPGLFVYGQRIYRGSLGASFPDQDFPMYLRWHTGGEVPAGPARSRAATGWSRSTRPATICTPAKFSDARSWNIE